MEEWSVTIKMPSAEMTLVAGYNIWKDAEGVNIFFSHFLLAGGISEFTTLKDDNICCLLESFVLKTVYLCFQSCSGR